MTTKRRLLVLGCTKAKRPTPGPAIEVYNGPLFQELRGLKTDMPQEKFPDVRILSAKYGLIKADDLIEPYDQLLDEERARQLQPHVLECCERWSQHYTEVFVLMDPDYARLFHENEVVRIRPTLGGDIRYRDDLRSWVLSLDEPSRPS